MAGKQPLPLRSVVITVDDGYASFYRLAYPLLKQHGLPATLFVYTDFIGAADAVSWPELQEMSRSGLVDVQAHSRTHRNLIERPPSDTDAQYQQTLQSEVRVPRDLLAQRLGNAQRHFAYPYGDANESVLEMLGRHHYEMGLSTTPGGNAFFAQPLMMRRTMVFGDMSLEAFKAQLQVSRAITPP
jgi:peptidoglycan/xylan/chitin deacetylase (PgdA/CDA1 family)